MKRIQYLFSALPFGLGLQALFSLFFKKLINRKVNFYYSQNGEDIILDSFIASNKGFYVDVGCNEPITKSNTFKFYLKGWNGITIDANKKLMAQHKKIRKRDIQVCAALSDVEKEVTFYKSATSEVSTINGEFYEKNKDRWNYQDSETIQTTTLTAILDKNLPQNQSIDLLCVDVEGADLEVLRGLDFSKYKPRVIIVELDDPSMDLIHQDTIFQLLTSQGYNFKALTNNNGYFTIKGYFDSKNQ
jgi:FkbM family methyltransferase